MGWVPAAVTERWDRLPACLFMNDGQDARRHQILFFFAFIFENPYIYRKQLHLVLAVPGSLLTREEAESFMDLLAATVRKTRHSA